MLSPSAIKQFYMNRPLTASSLWRLKRKHFRVMLREGGLVKLNRFLNRLNSKYLTMVTVMTPQATKPLEEVFCSKTRIKIIKLLDKLGQLNVSDVAHRIHANYHATITSLHILEDSGIVESRLCGRTCLFRLSSSPRAQAVRKVLETWEKETCH